MIKASHKQLKATLALGVKKLSPIYLASNLRKFPLFNSFLDLVDFSLYDFLGLDNFLVFSSTNFLINLLPSLISLNLLMVSILLVLSILLVANICDDIIVFNIVVNGRAILLIL